MDDTQTTTKKGNEPKANRYQTQGLSLGQKIQFYDKKLKELFSR